MKICVLQPDYSVSGVDYKNYDPARDLSSLMPDAQMDHVFINKLSTYKQLKELSKKGMTYLSTFVKVIQTGKHPVMMYTSMPIYLIFLLQAQAPGFLMFQRN